MNGLLSSSRGGGSGGQRVARIILAPRLPYGRLHKTILKQLIKEMKDGASYDGKKNITSPIKTTTMASFQKFHFILTL
jgi:hypothetical protein